jgi:predicted ATP-dependent protease
MPLTELPPIDLRLRVDPASLGFATTSELVDEPLPWIGQDRAREAARFGLQMQHPDYNLFVVGEVGCGRTSLVRDLTSVEAATRPVPPDLCYLHNFDAPERPRALRLPAGEGRLLRQLMMQLSKTLQAEIPKRLAAADVKSARERIEAQAKAEEDQAYQALSDSARARHFTLMREEERLVFTQLDDRNRPLTPERIHALSPQERAAMARAEDELRGDITRFLDRARVLERATSAQLEALRRQAIKPLLEHELQEIRQQLRKQIKDSVKLGRYLDQVQAHVLDNVEVFDGADHDDAERLEALVEVLYRLQVNVVVDNHDLQGAPVIVEDNPVFRALFGSIEYEAEKDVLVTDFSRVRAGSLLRAHGGFLLLHLRDLLADEPVWEKLRRFLRSARLQIEEPGLVMAPMAAVSLLPEPVDVDVKIVLIASDEDYDIVLEADLDFARRFRCKVDFAERFLATPETWHATAVFVAHSCRRLGLPHFSAEAVAALIEESHREAEDQARQSAVFARTEAWLMESAAAARARGAGLVEATDVAAALAAHERRHNAPEEQLHEALLDGERLLDVHGERIGQVNGLTVVDFGDYRFGFPVRVTARTHAGDEGLLNIEREVKLSGPIHDKGVMILHSHLSALFAHLAPLALSAAVVFEQEYGGVEGDSASCAEFYALLSALSALPLRQGLAVTGAINQYGEMLPVGGINEKIEGHFRACELLGLNGQQGVLIPHRNRRHLMLSPRVIEAVSQGRFHLHAAETAGEGMALLTGVSFGELEAGSYPPDTVLGRAQKTLQDYRRACAALHQTPDTGGPASRLRRNQRSTP